MHCLSDTPFFASQGYLVHFVPHVRNEVDLVPLACEDGDTPYTVLVNKEKYYQEEPMTFGLMGRSRKFC